MVIHYNIVICKHTMHCVAGGKRQGASQNLSMDFMRDLAHDLGVNEVKSAQK